MIVENLKAKYKHEVLRKNDVTPRNESFYNMVTTYAPALSKAVVRNVKREDRDIEEVKLLGTCYLHYLDEEGNSNKYHYYALVEASFEDYTMYAATNIYGGVGRIENFQLLGKTFFASEDEAMAEIEKHKKSKLRKGYEEIRLRRGSKKVNKRNLFNLVASELIKIAKSLR